MSRGRNKPRTRVRGYNEDPKRQHCPNCGWWAWRRTKKGRVQTKIGRGSKAWWKPVGRNQVICAHPYHGPLGDSYGRPVHIRKPDPLRPWLKRTR